MKNLKELGYTPLLDFPWNISNGMVQSQTDGEMKIVFCPIQVDTGGIILVMPRLLPCVKKYSFINTK